MLEDSADTRSLRFTIPPEAVAAYRAWKITADRAYLQAQIDYQGWAYVMRLGEQEGMRRIETLPAPGEAEPRYGSFGGGFHFTFRPARGGDRLTIEAPPFVPLVAMPPGAPLPPPVAAPLDLTAAHLEILAATLETPANSGVLESCPDDPTLPWHFGLTGPMLARLIAWGWDAAVPAAYAYIFRPTNVGCMAGVSDERSGTLIDLTEDVCW